ncbi:unnamed protein product [Caenorhabditis brenneri]
MNYPQITNITFPKTSHGFDWEYVASTVFMFLSMCPSQIDNSDATIQLLLGTIQTGLFLIFFDMMQLNFGWTVLLELQDFRKPAFQQNGRSLSEGPTQMVERPVIDSEDDSIKL